MKVRYSVHRKMSTDTINRSPVFIGGLQQEKIFLSFSSGPKNKVGIILSGVCRSVFIVEKLMQFV